MKKAIILLVVVGSLALLGATVRANTLTLVNESPEQNPAGTWLYDVTWVNSMLDTGDFVTLTGAAGITSATGPANWVPTFSATSVTWTWAGANMTSLGNGSGTITGFDLVSTITTPVSGSFNSQDHVNSGTSMGQTSTATGHVDVPGVPDGGSAVALLGIAMAGIEGVRRMIRTRKA